jgi:predicted dithiol-disulfide oxidoreductase (DUF899 family)
MDRPQGVSEAEWRAAREELLIKEKELTRQRDAEAIGPVWSFLDLTPFGRQETWEDSPEGYPQDPPYSWWRLHDEYDDATRDER